MSELRADRPVHPLRSRRPGSRGIFVLAVGLALAAPRPAATAEAPPPPAPAADGELTLGLDVRVRPLREGFWLHVSRNPQGIESNGLLAQLPDGSTLLVDTAWNDAQTEKLLDFAASRLGPVRDAVVTHAHVDRNGGVGALRRRGVRPLSLDLAVAKAQAEDSPVPDVFLRAADGVRVDPRGFELFYAGRGHTLDNLVVAFPAARLLFGGCLVKSADAGAGYVGEAFLDDWPTSIEALRTRYAGYTLVVPGHGAPGPLGPAFDRTVAVAREAGAAEARPRRGQVHGDVPESPDRAARWLLYVHGRILEGQGRAATSPDFGHYEYDAILGALAERGFEVISELRGADAGEAFVGRLVAQVRRLRAAGVPAERITLVGASRGGFLSLAVAAELRHPGLSLVVLAGCGTHSVALGPSLRGRILSIYDQRDRFAPSCRATFAAAPNLTASRETVLELGRDHGLVYRPYPEWLQPAAAWARGLGD